MAQDRRPLSLTLGQTRFRLRPDWDGAPRTLAWLADRLPFQGRLIHVRWSGEAGWTRLGPAPRLEPENATCYPAPGQLLAYAGPLSEPEILIAYGPCAFASKAGLLAGNPFAMIEGDLQSWRGLGESLLIDGALALSLDWG